MMENTTDKGHKPGQEKPAIEWYFQPIIILFAFFLTGPLALILVWFRPATPLAIKLVVTFIVVGFTVWMTIGAVDYYQVMMRHFYEISETMNGSGSSPVQ